jgi:hypothetical protein
MSRIDGEWIPISGAYREKETLIKLYWCEKLSARKIANRNYPLFRIGETIY